MDHGGIREGFSRLGAFEAPICLRFNRSCHVRPLKTLFVSVSRLGNGSLWYTLILLMPVLYGWRGLEIVVQMLMTGAFGLWLYTRIKHKTHRIRPYAAYRGFHLGTAPLDKFSFPSGHTLHAVMFTVIILAQDIAWAWFLIPLTALIALSRLVLGLHYPSDVLAGGGLGYLLALITLSVWP